MSQDCGFTGCSLSLTSCGADNKPRLESDSAAHSLVTLGQLSVPQFTQL